MPKKYTEQSHESLPDQATYWIKLPTPNRTYLDFLVETDEKKAVKEFEKSGAHLLHIARDDKRMAAVKDALTFFAPDFPIKIFPSWDCLPYDRISPNSEISSDRL